MRSEGSSLQREQGLAPFNPSLVDVLMESQRFPFITFRNL